MVRCREIRADDVDNVVALLARGFGNERAYWSRALKRLTDHPAPPGTPKYGYILENEVDLVGVVLLIFTSIQVKGESRLRCNVSSWYVEPAYRCYAAILSKQATRYKNTTYFNVSPAPGTCPILESQGFEKFSSGRTITVPSLNRCPSGVNVQAVAPDSHPGPDLDQSEINVLTNHVGYGCLSLICEIHGERHPFVFWLDRKYGFLPLAHLVYCRELGDFVRCAGPIGRFLARRGIVFVRFDSNGPTPGITGKHRPGQPKYRKGDGIGLGDLAYSEQVMFGH